MKKIYLRKPFLGKLSSALPLDRKVVLVHRGIRQFIPEVSRVAIADYDAKTDLVKTFLSSTGKA